MYWKKTEPVMTVAEEHKPEYVAEKSETSRGSLRSKHAAYSCNLLGAPAIDPDDNRPAQKPRLLRRPEVAGYPMRYRIPECDVQRLPMDPMGYEGLKDEIMPYGTLRNAR
jgi:hypothetical protein